jgi:hypothetical protein
MRTPPKLKYFPLEPPLGRPDYCGQRISCAGQGFDDRAPGETSRSGLSSPMREEAFWATPVSRYGAKRASDSPSEGSRNRSWWMLVTELGTTGHPS